MLYFSFGGSMVHIALIGEPTWESQQVKNEIIKRGCKFTWIDPAKIVMISGSVNPLFEISEYGNPDVVLFRLMAIGLKIPKKKFVDDIGLAILTFFEAAGVPTMNPSYAIRNSMHKHYAHVLLTKAGLPTPLSCYAQTPEVALKALKKIGYPAVIKPLMGSQGKGVVKVNSPEEAEKDLLERLEYPVIIEEYVEKVGNRDTRVFVVGEQAIAAMHRIAKPGTFITNVHMGGSVKGLYPVPDDLAELAIKAAKTLNLIMAGIDIMEDPDRGYMILETNSVPGFQGLYKATGVNMAPFIVEKAIELAKK